MTGNSPIRDTHCSQCGTVIPAGSEICWLCYAPVETQGSSGGTGAAARANCKTAAPPAPTSGFSLASLMMFVTLVSVVLGVSTLWPGAGIPLGVVAFLVWVRTANVVNVRAARGKDMTMAERVQLFLGSFGVAVAMIVLVVVSGCAALCAGCFIILGSMGLESNAVGIGVIAALIASVGIFATVQLSKFSRRRWRQQIGEQD